MMTSPFIQTKRLIGTLSAQTKRLHSGVKPIRPPKLTFNQPVQTALGAISSNTIEVNVVGNKAWRTFWRTGLIDAGEVDMYRRVQTGVSKNKSEAEHIRSRMATEKAKHVKGFKAFVASQANPPLTSNLESTLSGKAGLHDATPRCPTGFVKTA
ncbi:MAG: hypothetical protein ACKO37_02185 [Vampirovibrionales bacterium]